MPWAPMLNERHALLRIVAGKRVAYLGRRLTEHAILASAHARQAMRQQMPARNAPTNARSSKRAPRPARRMQRTLARSRMAEILTHCAFLRLRHEASSLPSTLLRRVHRRSPQSSANPALKRAVFGHRFGVTAIRTCARGRRCARKRIERRPSRQRAHSRPHSSSARCSANRRSTMRP